MEIATSSRHKLAGESLGGESGALDALSVCQAAIRVALVSLRR
jgi:hypothetical protein